MKRFTPVEGLNMITETKKEIKLQAIPKKFPGSGGYFARWRSSRTLSYDEVLAEVMASRFLNIPQSVLKMMIEQFFDTVIANTLADGNTRRVGDYFSIGVNIEGRFDELGDTFDPEKHKLSLCIRPLKRMKQMMALTGISPYNRNTGPKVVINRMYSRTAKTDHTLVFGDDIIIEGENLFILPNWGYSPTIGTEDALSIAYYTQKGKTMSSGKYDVSGVSVSDDGRKMTISWKDAFTNEFFEVHPEVKDPKKAAPVALAIGVHTHGGDPKAKRQLHRARAFFDSWFVKYPDYNTKGFRWGRI